MDAPLRDRGCAEGAGGPSAWQTRMSKPSKRAAEDPQPSPGTGRRGPLRWARDHYLIVLAIVAVLLLPVAALSFLRWEEQPKSPEELLAHGLAALDEHDYESARHAAHDLLAIPSPPQAIAAGAAYLAGVAADYDAENLLGTGQKEQRLLSAQHLADARRLGLPPGRESDGLFLLGRNLLLAGREADAVPVLKEALTAAAGTPREATLHRLLAQAHLRVDPPQARAAVTHLESYLAFQDLTAVARNQARLDRAEAFFLLADDAACRAALDEIPPQAHTIAGANILRGRLLMRQAEGLSADVDAAEPAEQAAAQAAWQEALDAFRAAPVRDVQRPSARQAMLLIGRCLLAMGQDAEALAQFQHTRQRCPETLEGTAAALEEADLLRGLERHDEAVEAYRRALADAGPAADYDNPWMPLAVFHQRVMAAYTHYFDRNMLPRAVALAERMSPTLPDARRALALAEAQLAWGRELLAEAEKLPRDEAEKARLEGRVKLCAAGQAYTLLAAARIEERDYADQLWLAAQAFLTGRDYAAAARRFRQYMNAESRRRRPAALLGLGESLLSQGRPAAALGPLKECMERHSRDAASFRARLLAARAQFDRQALPKAEELLRANIENDQLTPASAEWRESLYALAWLYHYQRRWPEAVRLLEEAVERYPQASQAVESRYLIAHAYGQLAAAARAKYEQATSESTRLVHAREMNQLLQTAIARYDEALDALLVRGEAAELSDVEQRVLRNCYFAKGAALADVGRHEEAIQVYSTAANRYQHAPEALEAYVRIADCYRRLGRQGELRGTLARARIVMKRLPPDAPYTVSTNYTAAEWTAMLDWLSAL